MDNDDAFKQPLTVKAGNCGNCKTAMEVAWSACPACTYGFNGEGECLQCNETYYFYCPCEAEYYYSDYDSDSSCASCESQWWDYKQLQRLLVCICVCVCISVTFCVPWTDWLTLAELPSPILRSRRKWQWLAPIVTVQYACLNILNPVRYVYLDGMYTSYAWNVLPVLQLSVIVGSVAFAVFSPTAANVSIDWLIYCI